MFSHKRREFFVDKEIVLISKAIVFNVQEVRLKSLASTRITFNEVTMDAAGSKVKWMRQH